MSLEINKILGAVFGTATFALAIGFVSSLVFEKEPMAKPGFDVQVAEAAPAAAPAAAAAAAPAEGATAATPAAESAAAPAAEAVAPIAERLKTADAAKGAVTAKACLACHSVENTGANKVGPGLWNVVNRKPGTHEGFKYSDKIISFGETATWDYDHLDQWLTNPKALVAGNKMAYAGLKKPEDRANVIAYLRSLSDSPAPLP